MKIMYGILSWKRDYTPTLNSLRQYVNVNDIVICTDKDAAPEIPNIPTVRYIKASANIAESYNALIQFAVENKVDYDYCFLIDDDIVIKGEKSFSEYIELMQKLELGVAFFGFNNSNMVFKTRHNPTVKITIDENNNAILMNRYSCTGVIGINLKMINKTNLRFDTNLKMLYFEDLLNRATKDGYIPYNGMYFDVQDSWNLFERTLVPPIREINQQMYNADKKYLQDTKNDLTVNLVLDKYLDYACEKLYGIKSENKEQ